MKDLLSALVGQGHIAVTGLLGIPLEAQQKAVRLAKQLSASVSVGTLEDEANHCLTGNAAQQAVEDRTRFLLRMEGMDAPPFGLPHLEQTMFLPETEEKLRLFCRNLRLLFKGEQCADAEAIRAYELLCRYGGGTFLTRPPRNAFAAEELERTCMELGRKLDVLWAPFFPEDGRAGAVYAVLEQTNLRPPVCFFENDVRSGPEYGFRTLLEREAATCVLHIGACTAPERLVQTLKKAGIGLYAITDTNTAQGFAGADRVITYAPDGALGMRMGWDGSVVPWPDAPDAEGILSALCGEAE